MVSSTIDLVERHWLGLTLGIPIAVYAAWIASLVVPEIVKAVVPTVVRAVTGT
jgi:hypothetical protein